MPFQLTPDDLFVYRDSGRLQDLRLAQAKPVRALRRDCPNVPDDTYALPGIVVVLSAKELQNLPGQLNLEHHPQTRKIA
jgi:hypothetical protein